MHLLLFVFSISPLAFITPPLATQMIIISHLLSQLLDCSTPAGMLAAAAAATVAAATQFAAHLTQATPSTVLQIPDYVSPSTRVKSKDEAPFARSGGVGLRWTPVRGPIAGLPDMLVRFHDEQMFVKLDAASCPPLKLFLEDVDGSTPKNWADRKREVERQHFYIESRKKGKGATSQRLVVVDIDALSWLLKERNCKQRKCHIPSEPFDKRELWRWQQWARKIPGVISASALGYASSCGESINIDADTDATEHDHRTHTKRKEPEGSITVESLAKKAKTIVTSLEGCTPEKQQELMHESLIQTHVGGMTDMKTRIEGTVTAARRLFIAFCTRATGKARDRLRCATECHSISKSASIQSTRGKLKHTAVPKRFKEAAAKTALLTLVETEWSNSTTLSAQHATCIDACKAGFTLSEEDKWFWGRVRKRARESVGKQGGVPQGVLDVKKSSCSADPRYIKNLVELESGAEFTCAERDGRERLQHNFGEYAVAHPNSLPKITKAQREKDLESESHGEIKQTGAVGAPHLQPIAAADVTNTAGFRKRLNPDGNDTLSDDDLVRELKKGETGRALTLGVEREILTENGKCKRAARFLDPRVLAAQWVLQWEKEFKQQEGNQTIELAMEPWMDGTTIGGHSTVASQLTFRPQDEPGLFGDRDHKPWLRSRLVNICDDTRETREVYELLVALLAVQMVFAATQGLKVKVRPGRTITVKLQIDAIRGDFHAQQAWNGCYMSGHWRCPFAFVPSQEYGCFAAFCTQIEKKLSRGLRGMNDLQDFYNIAAEIGKLEEGEDIDLGWCRVGDNRTGKAKHSQVHGAAPWARLLDFEQDLTTHGFRSTALAPDPEHCLMSIIKNVFYEFEQKMPAKGAGRKLLKEGVKQYCVRTTNA